MKILIGASFELDVPLLADSSVWPISPSPKANDIENDKMLVVVATTVVVSCPRNNL